ncbi:YqhG family protein [Lentibacillus sp. N15]|uniref:YqhG family protein n=1 Tax=Lentibacillus songyuanensis TaxID=3136161 RepID=UPI0031BA9C5D
MAIENLNQFLVRYFTAHDCQLLHNADGVLTIQLTEEMDKVLMNRPFYWHYIKKMGNQGDPMQLTLITNPERQEEKGEWIHYGSPRLHQIFNHLRTNEKYTKLFQQIETTTKTALYPWLVMNVKISYIGKQKKDELLSIGLQLVNGMMRFNMMDRLNELPLQMTVSDYCFTISPLIKMKSGARRIESVISDHIKQQSNDWAAASLKTLEEESAMLKHFYQDVTGEEQAVQMEKELQEMNNRYQPTISYNVINGGIFYLQEGTVN